MNPAEIAKLPTEPYRRKFDYRHLSDADDDLCDADAMAAENWNAAVRTCARMLDLAGHRASAAIVRAQIKGAAK